MDYYARFAVSLKCLRVDGQGKIAREAKVASEPEALIPLFAALDVPLARIGLEAARCGNGYLLDYRRPAWQWSFSRRATCATPSIASNRRIARMRAALHSSCGLAGSAPCTASHCRHRGPGLLTTCKLLQSKRHDVEMSIRAVLRGFGLKVGPTTPKRLSGGFANWSPIMTRESRLPRRC